MQRTSAAGRIEALDYLRGFFIFIIIIDHLWRWPNLFQLVSGRGELWVSAAEGFVIISGLLVGYIRGYKGIKKPFQEICKKLIARGVMLYIWAFITTILLVTASWLLTFRSNIAYIPYSRFDWPNILHDTFMLNYTHDLSHFLYLYAIFLVLAPILIWLLRHKLWWVGALTSIGMYGTGLAWSMEWMQWQALFFLPAIAGFYLDDIIGIGIRIPKSAVRSFIAISLLSVILSAILVLPQTPGEYHIDIFAREPLAPGRVLLSFIWFLTFAFIFNKALPWLEKTIGWLLMPFGTRSLTAYIVHSLPLMLIAFITPPTTSFWINTFIAIFAALMTWAIVKIPGINHIIPR